MPVPGRSRIGTTPVSRRIAFDVSVLSKYQILLRNPRLRRIFRADLSPYDPGTAQVVSRQFIDDRWWSQDKSIPERISTALALSASIVANPGLGTAGESVGVGALTLHPSKQVPDELDELADLEWDGRDVAILMGGEDFTEAEFEPVFAGIGKELTYNLDRFQLSFGDLYDALRVPIQTNFYAGTGGDEGGEELKGFPKPRGFGEIINAMPVKVDDNLGSPIYQVNDGVIERVDNVFDKRLALTPANGGNNDISELPGAPSTIRDALDLLSPSEWCQDVSKGLIMLKSPPVGIVTVDFRGAKFNGTFEQRAHSLVLAIVAAFTSVTKISLPTFALLDSQTSYLPNQGKVNLYITQSVDVYSVVREILLSVFAFPTLTRLGELAVFKFQFTTPVVTIEEKDIVSIEKKDTAYPQFRRVLRHAKNWTVFSNSDFGEGIDEEDKQFFRQEYRSVTAEDLTVRTRRLQATEAIVETLLDGTYPRWTTSSPGFQDDAEFLAAEAFDLLKVDRREFEIVSRTGAFEIKPGQTVEIRHSRFGIGLAGSRFIVIGVGENSNTGHVTLRIWG